MKKYILIIVGIALMLPAAAQQIPLYSQYYMNPFMYNPAFTGYRGDVYLTGTYRRQWTDINGGPETRALAAEGGLADGKVGLGGFAYMDYTDILERFGGYISYAYYIKFKNEARLGIGISAGVQQTSIDWNRASFGDEVFDPVNTNNTKTGVAFDGSAGLSFLWKGLKVGFSVPQLVETQVKYLNSDQGTSYTLARHYLATASYDISLAQDKFFIEPMAMFRYSEGKQWQIDGGVNLSYKKIIWVGAMYRYDYAVSMGGGFKVHDRISVGYSYDLAINDLNGYAGGTHEVFLSVRVGGQKKDQGIIEQIQQLQQNQDQMQQHISTIDSNQTTLNETNEQLRTELDEKDQQIQELEDQVKSIVADIAKRDSMATGTAANVNLPDDIVYKGSKEDLEFITGKPDNNYFMVVSSVKTEKKAREVAAKLKSEGHDVGVVYNKRRSWYYIFLSKPGTLEDGLEELYKIRKNTEFKDAWIHVYE